MTRITRKTSPSFRRATSLMAAALLALALVAVAAPTASADGFAGCAKTKQGSSGQSYQWKKDC